MNDRVFLDTNILVYAYSKTELEKQRVARDLVLNNNSFISSQVLQELTNTLTRKFNVDFDSAITTLIECCKNYNLHINTQTTILQACSIAKRYRYSFYDSLIISAALETGCSKLYSEDMNNG